MLARAVILSNRRNIIPLYHVVSDHPLPHIGNLYHARTINQFEKDLDTLCRYFIPSTLDVCANASSGKRPFFHLTFDDGLRECAEIVQPILLKRGIPATFFVNNDFIGNRKVFYRFIVSLVLGQPDKKALSRALHEMGLPEKNPHETLLAMTQRDEEMLNSLAKKTGVDISAFLEKHRPYMTENDIRALLKNGFGICPHSCSHADFSKLTTKEMISEIRKSTDDLNQRFGIRCDAFSFPFTNHMLTASDIEMLKKKVPDIRFFLGTSGMKDDVDGVLQRIPFEKNGTSAQQQLFRQIAKYRLYKLIGRSRVHR